MQQCRHSRNNSGNTGKYSIGMNLRLILGTETKVRRILCNGIAMNSQLAQNRQYSEYSITIVWDDISIFIIKKTKHI